jgi:hypothetical protein
MTVIQNRKSVLAIKEESTEGTPVAPSAATDFTALQAGFTMEPAFEKLESNEIRSSIGKTKPILGLENPTASLQHYLRHSGVEGTEPDFQLLLKCAFGQKSVNSTQRTTTTSSTVSLIKLGAGGSDFDRGKAVLIKDGTHGYAIRPVYSVSTNDLTLGFALPAGTAPGTGVGVGKCICYSPLDEGQPSLTLHLFRGNGGAYEMVAGARVSSYGLEVTAGQFMNQSFQLEGSSYYFNPILIGATDTKLDFYDGTSDMVATITAKYYKDPQELAEALQTSMNAQGSSDVFTVTYNNTGTSAGKFTISSNGATFSLKWNTGTNTANSVGDKIGFSLAADSTAALTYTSASAISWAAPYTPSYDSADPLVAKGLELLVGDSTDSAAFNAVSMNFSLQNKLAQQQNMNAVSGVDGKFATERDGSVTVRCYVNKNDADKFNRFRNGTRTSVCLNFGLKSGGNWVAGKCGCLYLPDCTIIAVPINDQDGLALHELTIAPFVDSSGHGEMYLNFL